MSNARKAKVNRVIDHHVAPLGDGWAYESFHHVTELDPEVISANAMAFSASEALCTSPVFSGPLIREALALMDVAEQAANELVTAANAALEAEGWDPWPGSTVMLDDPVTGKRCTLAECFEARREILNERLSRCSS